MASTDDAYDLWCRRFDTVDHEVRTLFHNRHIWKNLTAMAESAGTPEDHGIARSWINRSYASMQCLNVRRLNDSDPRTASLRQVLAAARATPDLISRVRWEGEAWTRARAADTDEQLVRQRVLPGYATFADASGDLLDIGKLSADLKALGKVTRLVSRYADKSVAHIDFQQPPDDTTLTFGGLDQAIAAVGDIYKRYYPLRHPGAAIWHLTPLAPLAWVGAFGRPWWTSETSYIAEDSLG